MARLAIGMVFCGQVGVTMNCLVSLWEHTRDFVLYIADNGSSRREERTVRGFLETESVPNIYVKASVNCGWIVPQNTLFSLARERYYACINNDIEVGAGWDSVLIDKLESDDKIWQVGPAPRFGYLRADFTGVGGASGAEPEYIEGWCFIVRRQQILEQFGFLFDNAHLDFMYCDDSDLSLRIRELGKRIAALRAPVRHLRRKTARPPSSPTPHYRSPEFLKNNYKYGRTRWARYLATKTFQ